MGEEKKGGKLQEILSTHGEKLALGVAALLLLAYLVVGVFMKAPDLASAKLRTQIKKVEAERGAAHPEDEKKKAPEAGDYAQSITYWQVVARADGASDSGATLLPEPKGFARPKKVIVIKGVKVPPITFGAAEVALDSVTLTWSKYEFSKTEMRKDAKDFDFIELAGYTLERKVGDGEWKVLEEELPVDTLAYKDTDIDPKTKYQYRVTSHAMPDELKRKDAVGMSVTSPVVETMGIWRLSFANPQVRPDGTGMAYVTIEKFDKEFGGTVKIKHIHKKGEKIGWWPEGDPENPVSKHRVSLSGGRSATIDFNSGMMLNDIAKAEVDVEVQQCKPKFDFKSGTKEGCEILTKKIHFSNLHKIDYTDDQGKKQTVYYPDPYSSSRVQDGRCEEHGGPKRSRTAAGPDAPGTEAAPEVDPKVLKEREAQKIFAQAEKAEGRKPAEAIKLYEKLLKEFADTDFIAKQKKLTIEQRLGRLKSR